MAKLSLLAGTTSKLLRIFVPNSSVTTGAGLTGLVYNSGSLIGYWIREGDSSATAITLATMTVGTWATGGFKEIDSTHMAGCYEVGIPNAALAAGAKSVLIMFSGATNMAPVVLEIELTAVDNQSATAFMTSVASVTGSVGSVTGAVGSVTGAVGSVTGNVGGNVVGSVGSVTGAVGSVTGNVGGSVVGSVNTVLGSVGSVAGNVNGVNGLNLAGGGTTLPSVVPGLAAIQAGLPTDTTIQADAAAAIAATTPLNSAGVSSLITTIGAAGVGLTAVSLSAAGNNAITAALAALAVSAAPTVGTWGEAIAFALAGIGKGKVTYAPPSGINTNDGVLTVYAKDGTTVLKSFTGVNVDAAGNTTVRV